MKFNGPQSEAPITPNKDPIEYSLSKGHIRGTIRNPKNVDVNAKMPSRGKFTLSLARLFGFQPKDRNNGKSIQFVKVDPDHEMRVAQSKVGKVLKTRMGDKLEDLFNFWLNETTDTITGLQNRFKRIAELEFAINNDPYLGQVSDLIADEATQIDQQDQLITVECANPRMKQRMEDLLIQWGITQNRVRAAIWNLVVYGDNFWSVKVTNNGVVRINPLDVRQVLERIEFNPMRTAADQTLKSGYLTTLSRDERVRMLIDTLEQPSNDEFADLFDSKLLGFAISNDFVVPPWNIVHFRLSSDQSEFYPYGKPLLLKALAPFRQANATMTLQSLARIMSFPITVYSVKTTQGMDEAQQFEKVEQAREEYENIGITGTNSETYSVNTKMWIPEGLVTVDVHSPHIDLGTIGDLELYNQRVIIASGVPKGYLIPEWGSWGVSSLALVEQFKPFGRKVFTIQSAFLEGITNLFRLHFAITGEFDYFEPFVLSMKFPNSEATSDRVEAKKRSLSLSKEVIDTIVDLIGSLNDPLPPDIVQDILTKFSFLDPKDIKKWIKVRTTKSQGENVPDESDSNDFGGDFGNDTSTFSDESMEGDENSGDAENSNEDIGEENAEGSPDEGEIDDSQFEDIDVGENEEEPTEAPEETPEESPEESPEEPSQNKLEKEGTYSTFVKQRLSQKRIIELTKRYERASPIIYEKVLSTFAKFDEIASNNRHYKYFKMDEEYSAIYKTLNDYYRSSSRSKHTLKESETILTRLLGKYIKDEENRKENSNSITSILNEYRQTSGFSLQEVMKEHKE